MKQPVNRANGGEPRKKRKSVAQILRASYGRFAKDEETLVAVKAVLKSGAQAT